MRLSTPLNQRRHDNVARVQLQRGGRSFEIACYRNKAVSYRNGVETDRDSVLQIERVFVNISRGEYAKERDLRHSFSDVITSERTLSASEFERACVAYILDNGVMQVNQMERQQDQDKLLNDICSELAECGVHPQTRRPYPVTIIRAAVQKYGYRPHQRKPAKPQAHELLPKLMEAGLLAIERAPMRLKAQVTPEHLPALVAGLAAAGGSETVSSASTADGAHVLVFDVAPDRFKEVSALVAQGGPSCSLQVLCRAVRVNEEGDVQFDTAGIAPEPAEPAPAAAAAPAEDKERQRHRDPRATEDDQAAPAAPAELETLLFAPGTSVEVGKDVPDHEEGTRGTVAALRHCEERGTLVTVDFDDSPGVELPAAALRVLRLDAAGSAEEDARKRPRRRRQLEEEEQRQRLERRRGERKQRELEYEYEDDEKVENRRERNHMAGKWRETVHDEVYIVADLDPDGDVPLSLMRDDDAGELREDIPLPEDPALLAALKQAYSDAGGESDVRVAVRFTLLPSGAEAAPPRLAVLLAEDGSAACEEPQQQSGAAAPDATPDAAAPAAAPAAPAAAAAGAAAEAGSPPAAAAAAPAAPAPARGKRKKPKGGRRSAAAADSD
eukprot:TRINITY_DN17765_c0_g1_i1.p1 TRINITY_DN17765_c0_g1~~TRINITY_DN17765_c0_g1_i1.p1  ORF type:complete len:638 (+),score=204.15 TRINITY_DN17765_c0_g1_i1:81-1916(+)